MSKRKFKRNVKRSEVGKEIIGRYFALIYALGSKISAFCLTYQRP